MTDTPNLTLPYFDPEQGELDASYNEALATLDALVMLSVLDRDLSAPPTSPAEGDRYLVKTPGSGGFAGWGNQIVYFSEGEWLHYPPRAGWLCHVRDESVLLMWNGSAWVAALDVLSGLSVAQNMSLLGVGTTADSTNPFSAKLNNALWVAKTVAEGGDGNLRYKLSKESAAKTLSLLLQDNFSGRAEIGLIGDDDLHFKVSADGSTWLDALLVDKTTGSAKINSGFFLSGDITPAQITADQNDYNPSGLASASVLRLSSDASRNVTGLSGGGDGRIVSLVNAGANAIVLKDASASSSAGNRFSFGADLTLTAKQSAVLWYDATDSRWKLFAGPQASGRPQLLANRTYYVRTDGNDANDGLTNSSGGAFLTIQAAINAVLRIDLNGYAVTIQVGNGTYTVGVTISAPFLGGIVTLQGDTTTPSNVVISLSGGTPIAVSSLAVLYVAGLKLVNSGGYGLSADTGAIVHVSGKMEYGACSNGAAHVFATSSASIILSADYTISGGSGFHILSTVNGFIDNRSKTITLTGTPAFGSAFAYADQEGIQDDRALTFSGGATGTRYGVNGNSYITTAGGGANYFPGNSAGSTSTGGQYI